MSNFTTTCLTFEFLTLQGRAYLHHHTPLLHSGRRQTELRRIRGQHQVLCGEGVGRAGRVHAAPQVPHLPRAAHHHVQSLRAGRPVPAVPEQKDIWLEERVGEHGATARADQLSEQAGFGAGPTAGHPFVRQPEQRVFGKDCHVLPTGWICVEMWDVGFTLFVIINI